MFVAASRKRRRWVTPPKLPLGRNLLRWGSRISLLLPALAPDHTGDNWGFCALYWLTKDFGYGRMFADSKVVGRVPPDENGQTKSPSAFC